jgi:hypothetical protein
MNIEVNGENYFVPPTRVGISMVMLPRISYATVAKLAGFGRRKPTIIYSTPRGGTGELVAGAEITVDDGMIFSVTQPLRPNYK